MEKTSRSDFSDEIMRIVPVLLRELTKRQEGIFSKSGLTLSNIIVLDILKEKGLCTMSELAQTLNLTTSAATGIVDKIIKEKLVRRERSRKDRRVVNVILVKKGAEMVRHMDSLRRKMMDEMYGALTDKERKEYLRMLKKVSNSTIGGI